MSDARSNAARYAAQRAAGEELSTNSDNSQPTMSLNAENKSAFIETAIQQAIRRGEFDNLPGAGKPLEKLGTHHDPDWWIRRKIETENLTGLGPPALSLRVENLELDGQLDLEPSDRRTHESSSRSRSMRTLADGTLVAMAQQPRVHQKLPRRSRFEHG